MRFGLGATAVVCALFITACGGGGGGGASTPAPVVATAQAVVITETNAKPVAANALDSAQSTSSTTGTNLLTGVQVESGSQAAPSAINAMAQTALFAATSAVSGGGALPAGVTTTQTENCPLGGSLSVTASLANSNSGLFAGDSISITATGCKLTVDGVTTTMSGALAMSIVSGSVTSLAGPFHVVMAMTATNLSVVTAASSVVVSGDARIDWTLGSTSETMVVTGSAMTSSVTQSGVTRTSSLKNFSQSLSITGQVATGSMSATVETSSTKIGANGGIYTLSTPTALVWNTTTKVLSAGAVKVVGASGSALLITVGANSTVTIQVDANGDGTYEKTLTSTSSELNGLL